MLVFTHDENKTTKNTKMLKIWENYTIHSKREKLDEVLNKKSPNRMLIKFHEFFKKKSSKNLVKVKGVRVFFKKKSLKYPKKIVKKIHKKIAKKVFKY